MYPDDKEEWPRVDTDEIITKIHKNEISDFLERLQDIFGLGIKMGYGSVKLFFDFLVNKYTQYVLKAGDTMTGDLNLGTSKLKWTGLNTYFKWSADHDGILFDDDGHYPGIATPKSLSLFANTKEDASGSWKPYIGFRENGEMWIEVESAQKIIFDGGEILPKNNDDIVIGNSSKKFKGAIFERDVEIANNSYGVILNSATKRWRVTIDDTGTLVTTQL